MTSWIKYSRVYLVNNTEVKLPQYCAILGTDIVKNSISSLLYVITAVSELFPVCRYIMHGASDPHVRTHGLTVYIYLYIVVSAKLYYKSYVYTVQILLMKYICSVCLSV